MWSAFAEEGLADAMVHGNFDSAPKWLMYFMKWPKNIDCGKGITFSDKSLYG